VSEAEIEALERPDSWNDVFDDRTRALLHLADAMSADTSTLEAGLITTLRDHFTEAELAELILVAGQANLNNRVGNAAKQLLGRRSDD